MKADRRIRENKRGINHVMLDGSDEVNNCFKNVAIERGGAKPSPLVFAASQRGTMPGEVTGGQKTSAAISPPQRGSMPGGVFGGPLEEHDPLIGVVNRHERFIDDITGQPLNPELCRIARRKEIDYFRSRGVWDMRRVQEAWSKTGRPPINVRWVEVNKGDDEHPNYRSRLVAREIRMAGEDSISAPTPTLESLRRVLSYAVTDVPDEPRKVRDPKSPHRCQVLAVDISRAYFNAVT